MLLNDLQSGRSCIASVGTQVLVSPDRWPGAFNHDGIENGRQLRHIMPIGSGHDERQRDATSVHQQMALAPIFFPRSVGFGPTLSCASGAFIIAPSMLCHRQALALALSTGEVCASVSTLADLDAVLMRPKFDAYQPPDVRHAFVAMVRKHATLRCLACGRCVGRKEVFLNCACNQLQALLQQV